MCPRPTDSALARLGWAWVGIVPAQVTHGGIDEQQQLAQQLEQQVVKKVKFFHNFFFVLLLTYAAQDYTMQVCPHYLLPTQPIIRGWRTSCTFCASKKKFEK